ncbi:MULTISPECIES: hypothetical protein [Nonomuraea]|uniref:DUF3800 domain-containing protein n=1 Tax=Nonomuraea harbinensis TaxID=1286938 RepID=A0ABW1BW05_9ACTN|nr:MULTISPECIES: hypothetical protein [Nonomuraea]
MLLGAEAAAECVRETRARIRSPATEYKANHLLRGKHRAVLVWLLAPSGPIYGRARVFLADKAYFAVRKIADLIAGDVAYTGAGGDRALAADLYREGPVSLGPERFTAFLESFNDVMRRRAPAERFFLTVEELAGAGGRVGEIMRLLDRSRQPLEDFLERPGEMPALDPLIPAIMRAVVHWGRDRRPVSILHDEHNGLTEERVAHLKRVVDLAGLRLADSFHEPRVQVADFLAGVARRIAEDELGGHGDPELVALLRPYVDPASVWGDERSWALLRPAG